MRSLGIGCLVLVGLLMAKPLQAGVYDSFERELWPLPGGVNALGVVRDLRTCTILYQTAKEKAAATGKKLEDVIKEGPRNLKLEEVLNALTPLEERRRMNALSSLDRIDLSACYIRLGQFGDAEKILAEGLAMTLAEDSTRFLMLANLAAAYHGLGEDQRAINYQEQALAAWPTVWAGWTGDRLYWYRRCERANLTLLRFRARESQTLKGAPWQTVDPLFPKVKFVGASGEYEAGAIAPRMLDELPVDSANLVLQLLLWSPLDDRLYWQLGELANAYGQIPLAATVFKDLERLAAVRELFQHRQVIQHAYAVLTSVPEGEFYRFLALLAPRSPLASSGLGAACNEVGPAFVGRCVQLLKENPATLPGSQVTPPEVVATLTGPPVLPSWQAMLVSFAAGCLFGTLVLLQWREWRRRSQRPLAPVEPDPREAEVPTATP